MSMTFSAPYEIDDVVLAYLKAVDSREPVDPREWLARYPQFADQLSPFFEYQDRFAHLARCTDAFDNPPPTAPAAIDLPGFGLLEEVGRGAMGVVYRARDTAFDRDVAIKILQDCYPPDGPAARRFLGEARITGQLQHPGIPAVHQVGTTPNGRPFLAMKLVKGQTLQQLRKARQDSAEDRGHLLGVFEQVCQAVACAHAHHVIHRDLKPANVMVGAFGEVQVMDWGLAKVLSAAPTAQPAADG